MAQSATIWPAAVSERSTALVTGPPRPAVVIAVFPTALYLATQDEASPLPVRSVLPIVARGGLRLPTAVTLATEVPDGHWGVEPGTSVLVGGGSIHLPGAVVAGVRTWRPRRMPTAVGHLLAPAVDVLSQLPHGPLRDEARDLVADLVCHRDPSTRVGAMVGAGAGLTPSGDDALCGVLLGLRLYGPDAAVHADTLWETLQARLTATTTLSASLLAESAQGYAVPPVVQLGEAVAEGATERVVAQAGEVLGIGHTSGADLLAGLVGCLEALHTVSRRRPGTSFTEPVDLIRSPP